MNFYAVDEGSEEQLKKKLKGLEDQIKRLTGTNAALTETIKASQKEKAEARHRTDEDDEGSDDNNSDEDESPALFASWKV